MKSPSRPAVTTALDAIVRQNSPPIKLKEYNGTTSIQTFVQQFKTCAAYYHWTEEDKGVYLWCQLTGDVATLLLAQPNADEIRFDELERMLEQDSDRPIKKRNFKLN